MLRFKVGELALIAFDLGDNGNQGKVVEITEVGPVQILVMDKVTGLYRHEMVDYRCVLEDEPWWCVDDIELVKLNDPDAEVATEEAEEAVT
jgi:hypothetical protein